MPSAIAKTDAMNSRIPVRALAAEALGTLLLVACVVGAGIMAVRLTPDAALQLLCNAIPAGAILFVLIALFAPISGAHFNPAVTLAMILARRMAPFTAALYLPAQIAGGITGTFLAHAMFALPILTEGVTARSGAGQWLAEGVATFGLVLTILGCRKRSDLTVAVAAGLYIAAAYWFTASTAFANPAVTLARGFTASFSGIRPQDVAPFATAQCLDAIFATICVNWIFSKNYADIRETSANNSFGPCAFRNSQGPTKSAMF